MLQKSLNSFRNALKGLKTTWIEEFNFRVEVIIAVIVVFCLFYFDFSFIESMFCVLSMTLVLSSEIINTSIEDLSDFVEPEHNYVIGKIKDTAAAFVLVSCLGSLVIGVLVFYTHFF